VSCRVASFLPVSRQAAVSHGCTVATGPFSPPFASLLFSSLSFPAQAVASHYWSRTIGVFGAGDHPTRVFRCTSNPTCVQFVHPDQANVVMATEGSCVSVWDVRVKNRGGCVHTSDHKSRLWTLTSSVGVRGCGNTAEMPLMGFGGAGGFVSFIEPRTWTLVARWRSAAKYSVSAVHALGRLGPHLESYDRVCLAVGTDHEVLCGMYSPVGGTGRSWGRKAKRPPPGEKKKQKKQRAAPGDNVGGSGSGSGSGGGGGRGAGGAGGAGAGAAASKQQPSRNGGAPGILKVAHSTGFRGTARWVGSAVATSPTAPRDGVTMFGLTEVGTLYRVQHAERMVSVGVGEEEG